MLNWREWVHDLAYVLMCLAILLLIGLTREAGAHEWYDEECCNELDCRPAHEDEVELRPGGYWVERIGLVSFTDERLRPSRDGEFHVCIVETEMGIFLTCLYVPLST